jgi:inorganic pyrophosphatase
VADKRVYFKRGKDMGISEIPFVGSYLEYLPSNKIARYTKGHPKDGIAFTGYPQQHPAEKNKLILVYDPMGESPAVLEFKIDDILFAEDLPQAVTEKGEGIPLVKLWVRRGAHGMLLEPFEVDDSVHFLEMRRRQKESFANTVSAAKSAGGGGSSPVRPAHV